MRVNDRASRDPLAEFGVELQDVVRLELVEADPAELRPDVEREELPIVERRAQPDSLLRELQPPVEILVQCDLGRILARCRRLAAQHRLELVLRVLLGSTAQHGSGQEKTAVHARRFRQKAAPMTPSDTRKPVEGSGT